MPLRSRPHPAPASRSWRRSFAASLALHAGVLAALFVGTASRRARGGEPPPQAKLLFPATRERLPDLTDDLEPEPERERELEVARVDEPILVRPEPIEPEPLEEDLLLERVELLPSPVEHLRPDALDPPPVGEPAEAEPPLPPLPQPVDPSGAEPTEEERAEPPEETIGDEEAAETAPAPLAGECPDPPYPEPAILRRIEGRVECRVTVRADGRVLRVVVERSSGSAILDHAATSCLEGWRFRPGTRGGVPAEMDVLKSFDFRLP